MGVTTQTECAPRTVAQCINYCQARLSQVGIRKGRKNQDQSYNFRGIDDVYNALTGVMSECGLIVIPQVLEREQVERKTRNGGAMFYTTLKVQYSFISANDGSVLTACAYGEGMDTSDKSTNKAMSAAYKYCMFQTFCIPTEAVDADETTPQVAARDEEAKSPEDIAMEQQDWVAKLPKMQTADAVRAAFRTLPPYLKESLLPAFTARADALTKKLAESSDSDNTKETKQGE